MKKIDDIELFIFYLYILKNIIEIENLDFFKKISDIFYILERDFLKFDNKFLWKNISNFSAILWEYFLDKSDFWYLEWNYKPKDILEIIDIFLEFFENNEMEKLEILDKKILEFLEKNNLLYLYN